MKNNKRITKRKFLKKVITLGGGYAGLCFNNHLSISKTFTVMKNEQSYLEMPMIKFGKYRISHYW